jgi:hypothetical protein
MTSRTSSHFTSGGLVAPAFIESRALRTQNLNLTPRGVLAETTGDGRLYFEADIVGVSEHDLGLIAAKVRQDPSVLEVHWHPIC